MSLLRACPNTLLRQASAKPAFAVAARLLSTDAKTPATTEAALSDIVPGAPTREVAQADVISGAPGISPLRLHSV